MRLRHILLELEDGSYDERLSLRFGFETRYLCNFLQREIRHRRVDVDGFSKIVIEGSPNPSEECPILPVSAACPSIAFDKAKYLRLTPSSKHEFFVSMLSNGLSCCAKHHKLPLAIFSEIITRFREANYLNEWVHKRRKLSKSILAELACSLDLEKFTLRLRVFRNGDLVHDKKVLATQPDEVLFHHRFKDVIVKDGRIVVTDFFNESVYTLTVQGL